MNVMKTHDASRRYLFPPSLITIVAAALVFVFASPAATGQQLSHMTQHGHNHKHKHQTPPSSLQDGVPDIDFMPPGYRRELSQTNKGERVEEEEGDRTFCESMEMIFSLMQRGEPDAAVGFPGIKPSAHVFWRTYPSVNPWYPEEGHSRDACIEKLLRKYSRVHLLDVTAPRRNEATICAVRKPFAMDQLLLEFPPASPDALLKSSKHCDTLHYCVGTVQHTWNLLLARRRFFSYHPSNNKALVHSQTKVCCMPRTLHTCNDDSPIKMSSTWNEIRRLLRPSVAVTRGSAWEAWPTGWTEGTAPS